MTDEYILMHEIINELEKDPPNGVEESFLKEAIKSLRNMTLEEFNAFLSKEIRFTAEEIKRLIDDGYYFYEYELHEIMDSEFERDMDDIDTDVVDVCSWAIVNHLHL